MPQLFDPVVSNERLHRLFTLVAESWSQAPARVMMQRAFDAMDEPDGNFLEQFQTSGFDARVWELYLSRYFSAAGFEVERAPRPDFILRRDDLEFGLEATTSNPTQGAEPDVDLESEDGRRWLMEQYLPIKFGSPLYSKLRERYWEEDRIRGRPLVLAIESFAFDGSLHFGSNALASYLYGLRPQWHHDAAGQLHVSYEPVEGFRANDVERPANFFGLPEAEHVSAVLFANSGTVPKFNRMGYQEGIGRDGLMMVRRGLRYVHDPDAALPAPFSYEVGDRMETWGEGVELFHNPQASQPLPQGVFPDATEHRLEDDLIVATIPPFHPFASLTIVTRRAP